MRQSHFRFILQQGFEAADASESLYTALMVQPRIIGGLVAVGVLFQSARLFLALSAVLLWSTLAPTLNPFDVLANHLVARPRGIPPLGIAPGPRRFAQGMSATVTLRDRCRASRRRRADRLAAGRDHGHRGGCGGLRRFL